MTRLHLVVDVPDDDETDPTALAHRLLQYQPLARLVHAQRDLIETQLDALEPHTLTPLRALFAITANEPVAGLVFPAPGVLWMRPIYRQLEPWQVGPLTIEEPAKFERLDFGGACTTYGMAVAPDIGVLLSKLADMMAETETR
jgi:hypothetical protein